MYGLRQERYGYKRKESSFHSGVSEGCAIRNRRSTRLTCLNAPSSALGQDRGPKTLTGACSGCRRNPTRYALQVGGGRIKLELDSATGLPSAELNIVHVPLGAMSTPLNDRASMLLGDPNKVPTARQTEYERFPSVVVRHVSSVALEPEPG
jgi:hypothetical protein